MKNGVAVLLASHGDFAKAALSSAELIIGKQENCQTMGVHIEDEISELGEVMEKKIAELDTSDGLVIITDLIGGTPMNLAVRQLFTSDNTLVVTGLNLPMVIELCLNRKQSIEELTKLLEGTYKQALMLKTSSEMRKGEEEDGDQIL